MTKQFFAVVCLIATIGVGVLPALPASAALERVRGPQSSAVYYVDAHGVRHPFPTAATFASWYGTDFSKVVTLSAAGLAAYPLGPNITIRPGTKLVKVTTAPTVYVVTTGGVLRALPDEDTAAALFGPQWSRRVIDLPDVFFSNYVVGAPIDGKDDVPDGSLLKRGNEYYLLEHNIVRPFASADAVRANRFVLADAIVTPRNYYTRTRPVTGFDSAVFNPVASALHDTSDCENKNLRAAFIIVSNGPVADVNVAVVEQLKQRASTAWSAATAGLSQLDVSYPTQVMVDDGAFTIRHDDGSYEVRNEVINTFFDQHPDQFDFIVVWTTFKTPTEDGGEVAHFIPVTNRVQGIGRSIIRAGEVYGSGGKLKGIISMGEIAKYHPDTPAGLSQALTYLLHEFLHQWSAYLKVALPDGTLSNALLREPDHQHWSYYAGFTSPLGGSGWQDTGGKGVFASSLSGLPDGAIRSFSPLDLYAMGLIPAQLMSSVFYVVPATPGAVGNTIAGTAQTVTIDQIIEGNGRVTCVQ
jgi:hypothetical protein